MSFSQTRGRYEANREQVVAYLIAARAHAATNGAATGPTGATVQAVYDSARDETTLDLFDGRPFVGSGGTATRARSSPLTVRGRLVYGSTNIPNADELAIFLGVSGAASAEAGYDVTRGVALREPACAYETGLTLSFESGGTTRPIVMSCATGEIVPDPSMPSQRGFDPGRRSGAG